MTESSRGPSPQAAYTRWVAACADAGWHTGQLAEQVSVHDGLGRVTAAAVHSRWPSPRFACAAMDGIAIAADPFAAAPFAADRAGGRVHSAAFVWVDTGDPIPAGLDTVVERERVELAADGSALVTGPVTSGRNVRSKGEDFQAGQLLIRAGHRLRPTDLAAAAAAGYAALLVARRPVVAIIPTGDEIRPVGSVLEPGEFTDSNSVMLAARAAQAGAVTVVTDVQPDDPDALAAAVREAAGAADLVLVIAGSSRGRGDFTAAVIAQVGGLAVHGVAVRPGHPVLLGHVKPARSGYTPLTPPPDPVPAIGVPGYPLAAAVTFELFAAPLLALLQGNVAPDPAPSRARLGRDWTSPNDVEEWVPVSLNSTGVAVPSHGHGAGAISRLARADAWWRIPIGQGQFTSGDSIEVLPF
jgi:molybdopterin molybdotransferase/putative molybdopterin biosynthesis protein